jgi:hypothetical protein
MAEVKDRVTGAKQVSLFYPQGDYFLSLHCTR